MRSPIMREYRPASYIKLIDETLAMVAMVSAATTTALEIQGVVSRAVVCSIGRPQPANVDTSELGEGARKLLHHACVREVGYADQLLAIPIDATHPFIGAVLIERRPDGITPRDRSLLQWLAKFAATIAPQVEEVPTNLADELVAVQRRHARESVAKHGSIQGASLALGMSRRTIRELLAKSSKPKK